MRAYNRSKRYKRDSSVKYVEIVLESCESYCVPLKYVTNILHRKGRMRKLCISKTYMNNIIYSFGNINIDYIKDRFISARDITCVQVGGNRFFTKYIEQNYHNLLYSENVLQDITEDDSNIIFTWDTDNRNKETNGVVNIHEKYRGMLFNYDKINYYK